MPIGTLDTALVVEAMACVDPTILAHPQRVHHPMCIAGCIKWAQNDFASIANAIVIGIAQVEKVGNRKAQCAVAKREHSNGDVQSVREDV